MRLFRCYNAKCPTENFAEDVPVCPECGADGRKRDEAHLVVEICIIHFDPPSKLPGHGTGYRACAPDVWVGKGRSSGEHSAVTCPACRETQVFKDTHPGESGEPVKLPNGDTIFQMRRVRNERGEEEIQVVRG